MTITRDEFDRLAERLAIVERREARFDELRELILGMRDDLGRRHDDLIKRFDQLAEDQITEDDWLAQMAELRRAIEAPRRTGPPVNRRT